MKNSYKPLIGLTLGDATGIGPELIVKSLSDEKIRNIATWVIIDDLRVFHQGQAISKMKQYVVEINSIDNIKRENGAVFFLDQKSISPLNYELGGISPRTGKASGDNLKFAVDLAKCGLLDGIVYGPLNKESLQRGGYKYVDDLHFFADLLNQKKGFGEINLMDNLWITRVTSHIPLRDVYTNITKENVMDRIKFAHRHVKLGGVEEPKIFVSALNPHCGEGGLSGTEEIEAIKPAIEEAQKLGINVFGPYAADTVLLRMKDEPFDCLLAMYHDQAQIGMKLLGFNRGVTISAGLPVLLATPAHGTAHDIAGKGIAISGPTKEAMKRIVEMCHNKVLEKKNKRV